MKTFTAITWNEDRIYRRVEVSFPEKPEARKAKLKPSALGIPGFEEVGLKSPERSEDVVVEEK